MKRITLAIVAIVALCAVVPGVSAQGSGYVIVVNTSNDVSSLSVDEVSRLFLKRTAKWDSGLDVVPVDQVESSSVRDRFSEDIHDKPVSAVKSFWQRQIFSGRAVPPTEKASDAEVLAFVRSNPAAIGYVSAGSPLGTNVRVVRVTGR